MVGEVILEIEASNTMYTLFHVKKCFNKIILLLLLENSIKRYRASLGAPDTFILKDKRLSKFEFPWANFVLFHVLNDILISFWKIETS